MNTTPLIDVMLVLLIMLILSIPVQLHAVNLRLSAQASTRPAASEAIRLEITAANILLWNGQALDSATLTHRLAEQARQAQPALIELRPDRHSSYQTVAAVLAAVQRAGLSRLSVAGTPPLTP